MNKNELFQQALKAVNDYIAISDEDMENDTELSARNKMDSLLKEIRDADLWDEYEAYVNAQHE